MYNIKSSIKDGILKIVITGELINKDIKKCQEEIIALEKSANVKNKLVDVRQLKGRPGVLDIYKFAKKYPSERPFMKIAFIDTLENAETASFHETASINAGLPFKWFTDIDEARKWITI